ncbi:MAG: YraN family protein [Clostridiales bacterium]|nr:YraN family protein [Clostridiales bacterium]
MQNSPQDVHKKVLGRKGERLVEEYLKKQGYKILHKNFRTPFGEADLIAQDGDEIAFIEVKARTSNAYGAPKEAVGKEKQRRYRKIAELYWLKTGEEPNARFDVAEVFADGSIEYYKYAF